MYEIGHFINGKKVAGALPADQFEKELAPLLPAN